MGNAEYSRDRLSAETLHSHQIQIHLVAGAISGTITQIPWKLLDALNKRAVLALPIE